MLLGVFLKVTPFSRKRGLDEDAGMAGVEKSLRKYFGKRSEQVVQDNLTAVRRGYERGRRGVPGRSSREDAIGHGRDGRSMTRRSATGCDGA